MPYKDKKERAAYNAAYRAAHREERAAYNADYETAHREERLAYHAAHREERRAYDAKHRDAKTARNYYARNRVPRKHITSELISTKIQHLKLQREIKKLKEAQA